MEVYSSMGVVMVLYVTFCFSYVIEASALSICIVLRVFIIVLSRLFLYVYFGSNVSLSTHILVQEIQPARCWAAA